MGEVTTTQGFSREDIELVKATVAKGASDAELKLFLHRCRNMGFDPLKPGQIHFVKYGNNPGTIVVGIDGFRARALATGKHRGTRREVVRDKNGRVVSAWCEVHREGWTHPAREEVSLAEYTTGVAMWKKMPETMLKKVAEAAALRMAFPDELGGLYSQEEMDQAAPRDVSTEDQDRQDREAREHLPPAPASKIVKPQPAAPVATDPEQQLLQLRRAISAEIKARNIDPTEVRVYVQAVHGVGPNESLNVAQATDLLTLLQDETTTAETLRYLARPEEERAADDDLDRALQQPAPESQPITKRVRVSDIVQAEHFSPDGQPFVAAAKVEELKAYGRDLGYSDDEMTAVLQKRLHHTNWDRLVAFNLNVLRNAFNAGDGKANK